MKAVVCCIVKFENDYIREWVDYHLSVGFSNIYIYDNNDLDGERIEDALDIGKYGNQLTIIDVRGQKYIQKKVYNDFYHNYGFDWCAFIDVDEFITFNPDSGFSNIEQYLVTIGDCDAVHINWKCYGDNGFIRRQNKGVLEQFKKPVSPLDFSHREDGIPTNNVIKSIIKSGKEIDWEKDDEEWSSNPHTPYGNLKICNEEGKKLRNTPFQKFSNKIIYIRHYYTKTLEEYSRKIIRQCADCPADYYSFSSFYRINRITLRKLYFQYKLTKKYNLSGYKNTVKGVVFEILKFRHPQLRQIWISVKNRLK
jgi:hypothetical protein